MAQPSVTFKKGQGGLGRPLPGQDYISAMVFYTGSLPSGFSSSNRIKALYSVEDAENAGIKSDYSDATAAAGTYLISTKGNTGDTIQIKFTDVNGVVWDLGTYTVASADSTIALQGAAWAAVINAGTVNHGCTASFSTATLTVTLPKSQGIYPNTGSPLAVTLTGAFVGTLTQPSAATNGVASKQAVWHYHISEFFRMQPKGVLYVGFFAVPGGSYSFTEITTMQSYAAGTIRQIGIYKDGAAFASSDLTTIHNVCVANDDLHKPISALYVGNLAAVTDLSTLTDLATLTASKVSAVISQDGGGLGLFLWNTTGKTIGNLGAALGTVALAKVSESIAWVGNFNISDGTECETLAFGNGTLYANVSDNLLTAINDKRYIFLKKFVGISGSYWNDSSTAIATTSDYAYIENNRTIDKAIRGIYSSLLPSLNSPLKLNADGTLAESTTAYLETQAAVNLDQMVRDSEMSAYAVVINPAQNVLSTNKIVVAVQLVINGVARFIEVPIGFVPKIA